jgi:hypothetical protein
MVYTIFGVVKNFDDSWTERDYNKWLGICNIFLVINMVCTHSALCYLFQRAIALQDAKVKIPFLAYIAPVATSMLYLGFALWIAVFPHVKSGLNSSIIRYRRYIVCLLVLICCFNDMTLDVWDFIYTNDISLFERSFFSYTPPLRSINIKWNRLQM